jgi:transposase
MTLTELPNDIDTLKHLVLETHQKVVDRDAVIAERDVLLADRDAQLATHREQIEERDAQLDDREARIKELESQLAYLRHKLFGKRSEKIDPEQLLLFKELQSQMEVLQKEAEHEEITYTRRKGHGRKPLPDDLPVENVEYPLEDTVCPCCGESMSRIGEEVTEELDYNPGSLFKRRHIRPKYACRECEEGVHIAPMPARPIDKGIAGPGLLAHLLTSKYCDHIPLNRLQGMLRRHRVEIGVASLCEWVGRMADLLQPVYDGLRAELLAGSLIQSDDTPVPYQLESLKGRTATGHLWNYLCESSKLVLYDFTTSHSRAGPLSFLSGFEGTLLTDGHASYNEAVQQYALIHAGCWSHARRKFYDARLDDRRRCGRMLKLIQELFAVERKAKESREQAAEAAGFGKQSGAQDGHLVSFGDTEHLELRRTESAPLVAEIRSCADAWSVEVLPRSNVGQAVGYLLNQWQPLTRFLDDPAIPLHNNASERAMRHVVVGRNNWIFAGSEAGGHRAAIIYSIVMTCRLNGLDPFVYLRDVIDRLPRGEVPTSLLPAAWKAAQLSQAAP